MSTDNTINCGFDSRVGGGCGTCKACRARAYEEHRPINATLPVAPTHTLSAFGGLYTKPEPRGRKSDVDALLTKLGIRGRR